MKDQKKAKWLLGTSGVVLSAVLLAQFNDEAASETTETEMHFTKEQTENMSAQEKELVQLDWTNFEIIKLNQQQNIQVDRRTKRS